MTRVPLPIRQYAARIIIHETSGDESSAALSVKTLQVCQMLRPQLATLMGNGGFRALIMRALALAKAEIPWLHAARVSADGILEKLDDPEVTVEPEEVIEGSSLLLAELFRMMIAFIGAALALGTVRAVWPAIIVDESDFFIEDPQ